MKNELKVPTADQLRANLLKADALQSGQIFSRLSVERRTYWQKVLVICALLDKMPVIKTFEKWLLTNYFPYTYLWGTGIRKLFAFHGYSPNFRFHIDEVDFPLSNVASLTKDQLQWIRENSTFDKVNQSIAAK